MDREAAQHRLTRIRLFAAELAALEQSGVVALDEGQRNAIAGHHRQLLTSLGAEFDLDRDDAQRRMSTGMRIASLAGAVALSAAFALLIGYAYGPRLPVAVGLGLAIAFAAGALLAWRGLEWKEFSQRPELLLPLAAAVVCIGVATGAGAGRRFAPTYRMVGLFVLFAALWSLSISVDLSVLSWTNDHVKATYQVLGFATAAAAVAIGLKRDWNDTTNLGAVAFLVFLYTKFAQWWWDWMPAYLFFFTIGGISIAIILVLNRARTALAARASS